MASAHYLNYVSTHIFCKKILSQSHLDGTWVVHCNIIFTENSQIRNSPDCREFFVSPLDKPLRLC